MEDWAEIRRLHRAEGMGIKAIARRLGIARNTVRDALRSEVPQRYERGGRAPQSNGPNEPTIRRSTARPARVQSEGESGVRAGHRWVNAATGLRR